MLLIWCNEKFKVKLMVNLVNKATRQIIGSVLIVSGTAIGAGMLALPLVTAQMAFGYSVISLVLCWLVMTATAFLVLEANLAFKEVVSFSRMAKDLLGPAGQLVTWITYCFLLYALTAAYIAGGGSLLEVGLARFFHIHYHPSLCALVFTCVLGFVVVAGTLYVDVINRGLMGIKLLMFIALLILLGPKVNVHFLKSSLHDFPYVWATIPILITSFGFHIVIPPLRAYLKDDVAKMRKVLWLGAFLPLVVYVLWEFITLGVLPAKGPVSFQAVAQAKTSIGGMVVALEHYLHELHLSVVVSVFSDIAVTTSFLGVTLGLLHFLQDGFSCQHKGVLSKGIAVLLTYVPPLLFALIYPHGFVLALGYASIFVSILLIILPVMMVWRLRKHQLHEGPVRYRFGIGPIFLVVLFLCGCAVIVFQGMNVWHLLPK